MHVTLVQYQHKTKTSVPSTLTFPAKCVHALERHMISRVTLPKTDFAKMLKYERSH